MILSEIAAPDGRSERTSLAAVPVRLPEPTGKRGRWDENDPADVD